MAKAGLRALARRWLALDEEVRGHDVPQGLPARRHPLRQARQQLRLGRRPRRRRRLLVLIESGP
jgi:hypothetical protein